MIGFLEQQKDCGIFSTHICIHEKWNKGEKKLKEKVNEWK